MTERDATEDQPAPEPAAEPSPAPVAASEEPAAADTTAAPEAEAPATPAAAEAPSAPAAPASERPAAQRTESRSDFDRDERPRGGGGRGGGGGGGRRFGRRKVCTFCVEKAKSIDYKDPGKLRRYLSDRGRIEARRKTGTCAKHQRWLALALKRARHLALMPYSPEHIRVTGLFASRR